MKRKLNLNFHIVGSGSCESMIESSKYPHLNISSHGSIPNNQLASFIRECRIGLAFGMGTSVLETSSIKIPSMIIDPSYTPIPCGYSPRWLHNTEEYSLGEFNRTQKGPSLESHLDMLFEDENNDLGNMCYNYTIQKHSLRATTKAIYDICATEN